MKLLTWVLIAVTMLPACSLIGGGSSTTFNICSAVSAVEATQQGVEGTAQLITTLYASKTVTADVYNRAKTAYGTWASSQVLLTNALIAVNDAGGNPTAVSVQEYVQLGVQAALLAANFIAIYETMNKTSSPGMSNTRIVHGMPAVASPVPTPAPVTCVETDDQIRSSLVVMTWPGP